MFGQRNHFTRKKLEEHGTSAPATVLEIADRGMTVTNGSEGFVGNTEVILKTRLRVEPPSRPAFEVHQKFRYPQMSIPSAGSRVTVLFDPDDHDKVMIDRDALPMIGGDVMAKIAAVSGGGARGATLGDILATAQAARSAHPGDSNAMAEAVRASLGVPAAGVFSMPFGAAQSPEEDRIENLERLVALRDKGALTPEEFAAQKAALLHEGQTGG